MDNEKKTEEKKEPTKDEQFTEGAVKLARAYTDGLRELCKDQDLHTDNAVRWLSFWIGQMLDIDPSKVYTKYMAKAMKLSGGNSGIVGVDRYVNKPNDDDYSSEGLKKRMAKHGLTCGEIRLDDTKYCKECGMPNDRDYSWCSECVDTTGIE